MPNKCYGSTEVSKTFSGGSTPSFGAKQWDVEGNWYTYYA